MKIICLIESLGSGGAERQLAYLAAQLRMRDHDVEVWTYQQRDFYRYILEDAGVTYRYLEKASSKWKRLLVMYNRLKEAAPESVIAYLDTPSILSCLYKLLGFSYKLIVSERNTTQHITVRDRIKFFLYRFADYVVPNSVSQTIFIAKTFPILKPKIRTITNFVDINYFQPFRGEKYVSHPMISVVVVARVMPQKNPLSFIKAISLLKKDGYVFNVKWYGSHPSAEFYKDCMSLIANLSVSDVFSFMGQTDDTRSVYQAADVFCLPSIFEGYPNALCEAMSCGLPVLCSNVSDIPYVVDDGKNGYLFNPNSIEEMYRSLKRICDLSYEKRKQMGYTSRILAEQKFSMNRFINEYVQLIGEFN